MASKFPFGHLSKIELNDLYGLDFPSQLQLLPNYELRSKLSHISTLDKFDLDENYVQSINSKYFDIPEIAKLSTALSGKSFSLFHVILEAYPKTLTICLVKLKVDLDLIRMTETKQQIGKDFLVNVDVNDYSMYTQPSKLASGGVAIYVKDNIDHSRIDDMCTTNNEFEVLWTEIKNRKRKNFLCGCAYRHPNTDSNNFLEYLKKTFAKNNKNK